MSDRDIISRDKQDAARLAHNAAETSMHAAHVAHEAAVAHENHRAHERTIHPAVTRIGSAIHLSRSPKKASDQTDWSINGPYGANNDPLEK